MCGSSTNHAEGPSLDRPSDRPDSEHAAAQVVVIADLELLSFEGRFPLSAVMSNLQSSY